MVKLQSNLSKLKKQLTDAKMKIKKSEEKTKEYLKKITKIRIRK